MLRFALLCMVLAAPGALLAQVFPHIDRDVIEKNLDDARKGVSVETPTPTPTPDPTPEVKKPSSGTYKKYKELRDKYLKSKFSEKQEISKALRGAPPAIEVYLQAKAYLALGYYVEVRRLPGIKIPINDGFIYNPVQEVVLNEINNGGYYRLLLVARMWEDFQENEAKWDGIEKLRAQWEKSRKEGQKVINDFDKVLAAGAIDDTQGQVAKRGMEAWLETSVDQWIKVWRAHRACEANENDIAVWEALIAMTGPDRQGRNEDSPCFMDARAAIVALKECLPDEPKVKSGVLDALLVRNYASALQIESALKACAFSSSADAGYKLLMVAAKNAVEKFRDETLEDLKLPPG